MYLLKKLLEVFFEVFPLRATVSSKVLMHVKKYHSLYYDGSPHLVISSLRIKKNLFKLFQKYLEGRQGEFQCMRLLHMVGMTIHSHR